MNIAETNLLLSNNKTSITCEESQAATCEAFAIKGDNLSKVLTTHIGCYSKNEQVILNNVNINIAKGKMYLLIQIV